MGDETIGAIMRRLSTAQKGRAKGAPGYSVYVNRPVGRVFAAVAHRLRMTPDAVTGVSAVFTFAGIAIIAAAPPSPALGVLIWLLLAVGYALDSADGQVARLRGGGSVAGEWLDHFFDSLKIVALPLATAVGLFRIDDVSRAYLLVPLGFAVVATATFFGMILNDLLKVAHGAATSAQSGGGGALASLLRLPVDYGIVCMVYLMWGWTDAFLVAYALFFAAAVGFCALAAVRWFRQMRALSQSGAS